MESLETTTFQYNFLFLEIMFEPTMTKAEWNCMKAMQGYSVIGYKVSMFVYIERLSYLRKIIIKSPSTLQFLFVMRISCFHRLGYMGFSTL